MFVLAFDTETDGLVNNREPPQHPSQPNLVELGAVLFDLNTGHELNLINLIIHPGERVIPKAASDVHGITTAIALAVGIPLIIACATFSHLAKVASAQVAHNADFDVKVLAAAFHRLGKPMPALNCRCTKNLSERLVNLPPTAKMVAAGFNKPKSPSLTELIKFLFDEDLIGAHGALADARACGRAYRELVIRGIVPGVEIDDGSRMTDPQKENLTCQPGTPRP